MNAIKKKISIFDPTDKYTHWLIPKFTLIAKRARFTIERLGKMIVGKDMIAQEKEVLTKMLYNRKVVLAWDFIEMKKFRREVAFPHNYDQVELDDESRDLTAFITPLGFMRITTLA